MRGISSQSVTKFVCTVILAPWIVMLGLLGATAGWWLLYKVVVMIIARF